MATTQRKGGGPGSGGRKVTTIPAGGGSMAAGDAHTTKTALLAAGAGAHRSSSTPTTASSPPTGAGSGSFPSTTRGGTHGGVPDAKGGRGVEGTGGDEEEDYLGRMFGFMQSRKRLTLAATVCFLVLVRCMVALHSHSGEGKPPMYGDYEAQRHWMEITVNLPATDWYRNTSENDLLYWGLDYPPLTAYHSWMMGQIGKWIEPAFLSLHSSRGYESVTSKLFMRGTVIAADLLIFLPAVYAFVFTYYASLSWNRRMSAFFLISLQPALLLIDHGHFQYNNVSLGLVLWAIVFILKGSNILGSVLFCLALNFKQMSLYYAPTFFFFLVARAATTKTPLIEIVKLSITVILTFALCWIPFLSQAEDALHVLWRMFPVDRGLYEDKVANFWCALSPALKLRQLFITTDIIKICAGVTFVSFIGSNLYLLRVPTPRTFLISLFVTALSFFLFSYHVHEKSILLPLLPLSCLILESPYLVSWFHAVATFTMYPLLAKDGLGVAYAALLYFAWLPLALNLLPLSPKRPGIILFLISVLGIAGLHILRALIVPPERYPDLFDLAISAFGCAHFMAGLCSAYAVLYCCAPNDSSAGPPRSREDKKRK